LWAAAWNVPSLPTRSLLGSDILRTNPNLSVGFGLVHVGAVRPDVAVIHVQRADAMGRAHVWGPLGITEEAGLAADNVIITCEELVDSDVILSDPNRILLPETKVVAVVQEPGGAHPSPVQGHFKRDHAFYRDYAEQSRTEDGFASWLKRWVVDVPDRASYLHGIDLESVERSLILKALDKAGGNVTRAARLLGLSRRTLQYRLEKMESAPERAPGAPKGARAL